MSILLQDLRYALRGLLKSPGYTIAAVLVLALGIGANTAVFSVIDAVLLRPLPYPNPEQLVSIRECTRTFDSASVSLPDFLDWRAAQHSFTDISLSRRETVNLSFSPGSGVPPERVKSTSVTANYLTVFGVQPTLGRNFTDAEDTPGGPLSIIISEHLWRLRFAASPRVLGQRLMVDGEPREIIGVLPAWLNSTRGMDVLVPLGKLRAESNVIRRDNHPGFSAFGRLRPGMTLAAASREFAGFSADLQRRYPESNTGWNASLRSLHDYMVGSYRQSLYLLLGAVGCVLLIACANVANLQLARATGRTKELAVRAALGASRARLVRQMLTESVLVAVLGGLVGVLLALWAVDAILHLAPTASARFGDTKLDLAALGFTAVVALGTGLLAGAWPAWRVTRSVAMSSALHESGARGSSGGASQQRARAVLVVLQVALAVVLLTGAGLTLQSFWRVQNEPLGFRTGGLLTMSISLPTIKYPLADRARKSVFYTQLLEKVRALPGVASAGMVANMPFSGSDWESSYHVTGTPEAEPGKRPETMMNSVSPAYFKTMGTTILRGRDFSAADAVNQPRSVIVDEMFARKVFPGQDAVGQHLDDEQEEDSKKAPPVTIVGVVAHVRNEAPGENPVLAGMVQMYYCINQGDSDGGSIVVSVASGDPLRLAEPVRRVVQSLDPELPVAEVNTMENTISTSMAAQRLTMVLLATFAGLALVLASIGLYGVMSLGVTQRTRELGIRLALGAQRSAVMGLVMRQGTALVGVGLLLGLLVALALGRGLASILYGVTGSDPVTLGVVTLVLAGTALLACWMPARRAMRVDPMVALRDE